MNRLHVAALSLTALLMTAPAFAQQSAEDKVRAAMTGLKATVNMYPTPWPLRNLITGGVLTVALTGDSPPADFVDPVTGELTGFIHDVYEKLGKDLGLKVEFSKIAWAASLPGLKANRFDMACAGAAWNAKRLGSEDFLLTSPTTVTGSVGLALKSSNITSWSAMKGKRLGGVQGEIYLEDARKSLTDVSGVTEFPGAPEGVLALQNQQVDLFVNNLNVISDIVRNAPNKEDLVVVGPPLSVFPEGLCVNPREADLLQAVDVLLANYRADGTLKALSVKYGAMPEMVDLLKGIGY